VVANPLGVSWGEYRPLTVAYVRVELTPDVDRRNEAGTPLENKRGQVSLNHWELNQ
jgi:hypothetical protein